MKNSLDLLFDNYKDHLTLSKYFTMSNEVCNEKEAQLRKSLNKEQLKILDDWIMVKEMAYENAQKEVFNCGAKAGAQMILTLLDKEETHEKENNLYDFGE